MADVPDPRRSLERLEVEQGQLCEQLLKLTPAELEALSAAIAPLGLLLDEEERP